jgi:hypothetical protein
LHAAAELLLAGPQHRESATIRLRVVAGGFATVAAPDIRVEGAELVTSSGRHRMRERTPVQIATAAGLTAGPPVGVYREGSGVGLDEMLSFDDGAVSQILAAYAVAVEALRRFAPDTTPVLWPEHFDVGIRLDDTNFGVSPGDDFLPEPYAYVGVDPVPDDPLWNAPFGRARTVRELGPADAVSEFFEDARSRIAGG